jgi:hypothetical protein
MLSYRWSGGNAAELSSTTEILRRRNGERYEKADAGLDCWLGYWQVRMTPSSKRIVATEREAAEGMLDLERILNEELPPAPSLSSS